jgi:flagellar FliL protein
LASTTAPVSANSDDAKEYNFFPVEKVIVSLQDEGREHYFVIDLVLQSDKDINLKKLEKIDPIVRSSAVAYLSRLTFSELRTMPVIELQAALEKSLFEDFASKNIVTPFAHVLVSKLIVQ